MICTLFVTPVKFVTLQLGLVLFYLDKVVWPWWHPQQQKQGNSSFIWLEQGVLHFGLLFPWIFCQMSHFSEIYKSDSGGDCAKNISEEITRSLSWKTSFNSKKWTTRGKFPAFFRLMLRLDQTEVSSRPKNSYFFTNSLAKLLSDSSISKSHSKP